MANSSANERPRSFLIKVNPDDAPRKVGVPKEASEWEGGAFLTNRPRKEIRRSGHSIWLSSEKTDDPQLGDRLYIWINEKHGGKGLTASARASRDAVRTNFGLSITVSDIELLLAAGIDRNRVKRLAAPDNVFDDILRSTSRVTLRWIPDKDAREIDQAAGRHSTGNPPPPSPLTLPPPRLPPDADTVLAAGSIGSVGNHGQGFQMSTAERKAVEKRAMCVASKQLREEGRVVENKSSTESYDLLCSHGNRRAYAEVKGTATCGEQVVITHAEVEFAPRASTGHVPGSGLGD